MGGEEDGREKLIRAAIAVLERSGPEHFSAREVAREANVSVSLISHHFDGKDGLMEACLEGLYVDVATRAATVYPRLADPEEALDAVLVEVCLTAYRIAADNRALLRYVLKRVAERGGLAAERRDNVQDAWLTSWSGPIAERTGRDVGAVRLRLHAALVHVIRLAIASERDRAAIVGQAETGAVDACTEAHVRDLGAFIAFGWEI